MHPFHWWKFARTGGGCGPSVCDPSERGGGWGGWDERASGAEDQGGLGSAFGVRRPLRFLAYKLELGEAQVADLARILADLKTERAQAAVDHRRTVTAFADALGAEAFDQGRADEGARLRLESAERLRGAVLSALRKIHEILRPEQRAKLAYLIRTGTLTL